jgi:hypothetical protein
MQRDVNTTREEEMFSMCFSYIHCWETEVFAVGPPRGYVSNTEPNEMRMGIEGAQRSTKEYKGVTPRKEDFMCIVVTVRLL